MSRRVRIERGSLAKSLALHSVAALAFAIAAVGLIAAAAVARKSVLPFGMLFGKLGTFYVLYYFFIYWAITGALHAVHYYREAQERQEKLMRERLEVLRSKLNPHFLFNTLNAISTLALQRDHERVAQSLGLVGDMLRASLDDNLPQEIPLAQELQLTDKYLAIESIRFGDRLRVERVVDPSSLAALVPSMLLQPLVENAIIHGVAAQPGDGWVRIEAKTAGGRLQLAVTDSGNGFSRSPRNGIGLRNTRERLETMYGSNHQLRTGTAGGGCVEVDIPLRSAL
ncbi:MAG TPA: sensor histidine kinase, partial [Thermoanaerobaculia bacterium]